MTPTRARCTTLAAGLAAVSITLAALPASALPPFLRPNTHPWFLAAKGGGSLNLRPRSNQSCIGTPCLGSHQAKVGLEVGMHFGGSGDGPAIALDFAASFGSESGQANWTIELGPRFFWDIPVIRNLGFYLSPGILFGYASHGVNVKTEKQTDSVRGLTMQATFDLKLALGDRGFVFVRPIGLGLVVVDRSFAGQAADFALFARWDLLAGAGLSF